MKLYQMNIWYKTHHVALEKISKFENYYSLLNPVKYTILWNR